jgi:hypothetical protein
VPPESREDLEIDLTDLLIAAPAFENAGVSISEAVSETQSELDFMGAFWGNDEPGQEFAHGKGKGYAYYQPYLLNLIGIVAAEVQGITAGLNEMASRYGVAEQANVGIIRRLDQEEQW